MSTLHGFLVTLMLTVAHIKPWSQALNPENCRPRSSKNQLPTVSTERINFSLERVRQKPKLKRP